MFKLSTSIITKLTKVNTTLRLSTATAMPSKALLLLATDSEEMEAVISTDVMRRGGISVTVAGIDGKDPVKCSRGVVIVPDIALSEVKGEFDAIVLPGGFIGSPKLAANPLVGQLLKQQWKSNRVIAAICFAPLALKMNGIGFKRKITSHPLKADEFKSDYDYKDDRVVVDGQLITSQGVGTAFEFALAIVEKLMGSDKLKEITPIMILKE